MPTALSKKWLVAITLVACGGAALWWNREALVGMHYLRQLQQADDESREVWAGKVASLSEAPLSRLVEMASAPEERVARNGRAALFEIVKGWQASEPRATGLTEELAARFSVLAKAGKEAALQVPILVLTNGTEKTPPSDKLVHAATELLFTAEQGSDHRLLVLRLADALLQRGSHDGVKHAAERLALEHLQAPDSLARLTAIQVLLRAPLRQEQRLLEKMAPLLKDGNLEIRKAALVALGPARDIVSDDELLPLLHDPDDGVQQTCEMALRSRGLTENHILLARFISDDRPSERLQVLQHLRQTSGLDGGVWLRRLCQDPVPAVRAAAARAAAYADADLGDCLLDMSREDPSPTVRQLARFYWAKSRER